MKSKLGIISVVTCMLLILAVHMTNIDDVAAFDTDEEVICEILGVDKLSIKENDISRIVTYVESVCNYAATGKKQGINSVILDEFNKATYENKNFNNECKISKIMYETYIYSDTEYTVRFNITFKNKKFSIVATMLNGEIKTSSFKDLFIEQSKYMVAVEVPIMDDSQIGVEQGVGD